MYMQRNGTDKFIGTAVSCDITSTGCWYGDLPDCVPIIILMRYNIFLLRKL